MHFEIATTTFRDSLLSLRPGETRLGERIGIPSGTDPGRALAESDAGFVLVGIPEDIGVRANLGVGGAHTAWIPALRAFLNTQSNRFVDGSEVLLLGHFNFDTELRASEHEDVDTLRARTSEIDELVAPVIRAIAEARKTPLVIGGGHNNAYPILKGCSKAFNRPLNCINLDAHSDYRRVEGRHSGNGFRYARNEGYLQRYALPWLHEAYNSEAVAAELGADPMISAHYREAGGTLEDAVVDAIRFTEGYPTGIELDLDCITGVLSSAATPSGITAEQAQEFIRRCARECDCAYLHLTEGATELRDGRKDPLTAKLISYLLRDFIAALKARGTSR